MRISYRFDILSPHEKVDDGGLGGRLLAVGDAGGCHRHDHDNVNDNKEEEDDHDHDKDLEFQCCPSQ